MGLFDGFAGSKKSFSDLKKYVDDFEVIEEKDAKGRTRQKARYIGPWTVLRNPSAGVFCRMWICVGLAALLVAAYFRMLLLTHLAGSQLLVLLPLVAGLFPAMYLIMGVFTLPLRGKPMRRDQYMHSFIRASRSSAAIAVFVLVGQIAALIFRATRGDWLYMAEDWTFTACGAVIIACALGIIGTLHAIDLAEKPNSAHR